MIKVTHEQPDSADIIKTTALRSLSPKSLLCVQLVRWQKKKTPFRFKSFTFIQNERCIAPRMAFLHRQFPHFFNLC